MIKTLKFIAWAIIPLAVLTGCQEQFELNADPPTEADAAFTVQAGEGVNNFVFRNESNGFMKKWDFGNGTTGEGDEVIAYYPFEGEYEVKLTVFSAGGSVSSTQSIQVNATDPEICNVEVLQLLTGGCDQLEGKTWVIDKDRDVHFGLGPITSNYPDWYRAVANEKVGGGLYDDEFTFVLNQSVFIQETNGDVYVRADQGSNFPGAQESDVGDLIAPYTAPEDMNYSITSDGSGNQFINLSAQGFIGYYTGVNQYQIISIDENELFIKFKDSKNAEFAWYHRLIPKGYAPVAPNFTTSANGLTVTFTNTSLNATSYSWDFGDGNTSTDENPEHTYAADGSYEVTLTAFASGQEESITKTVNVVSVPIVFPITFEDGDIVFGGFGGTVFSVIDNPDASGINTSGRVGQYVKGFDGNWAGIELTLDETIDFTDNSTLAMKVWSPVTGRALFKIEVIGDPGTFVEVFADITQTNQWQELTFDFSGAASDTYGKIALFMDFDNNNGGTFYIDDVGFYEEPASELTLELLTGGNAKSWVLKPGAGSFGVGPAPGSDAYFPNGADISGDRACLWNDEFIFKTGGQYEYKTNGDIFGETYMDGLSEGCQSDANLAGTDAEAWGSGIHSFSFTPATESANAVITVRGTGAFIVLPKAYNGGEYGSAPPDMDAVVNYQVLDYSKTAAEETLSLSIDVSGDGSVFWNFILVPLD